MSFRENGQGEKCYRGEMSLGRNALIPENQLKVATFKLWVFLSHPIDLGHPVPHFVDETLQKSH